MTRDYELKAYVTKDEAEEVKEKAKQEGRTVSNYMRHKLIQNQEKETPEATV